MTSAPTPAPHVGVAHRTRGTIVRSATLIIGFIAVLWLLEGIDTLDHHGLDQWGIQPRDTEGLRGIAFAPLLHAGWEHLASNSLPALVLGFVGLLAGTARFVSVTALVWVVSGAGVWVTGGAHTIVIGLSGVIFGWMTYLLLRGFFNRDVVEILVGVVLLVVYGGILWGVLPGQQGISWQAHLFGAVGGVLAAALLGRRRQPKSAEVDAITHI